MALWLVLKVVVAPPEKQIKEKPVSAASTPAPEKKNNAEAEVVAVLAALQSKGRFIDFLMDDISKYSDAQVGGAARVVHQGCKSALDEIASVVPVASEKEGETVTVPKALSAFYSLSGSIAGEGPHSGKLVHKGWMTNKLNLPRVTALEKGNLPPLAPAQVEVK
ncbi:DUF2760 domain-containing protein [Pelagicoccus albus]|uniref:DUF2760 domain-containing protein n=2 Tax=Pelagicoccus albus TaxID=415222 RepID=A0A7X1B6Q7_9BACT|nr:DUF2760 domain-containing protein [Pelagicoccus albus]